MKISIVILNWNGKHYLEQFLPSVVKHSQIDSCEIIIADNGSSDDSIFFLRQHYPQVRLILLDKNYGFAEGYNKALQQVDSEYFVLLNSDVELSENWLQPIIEKLDKTPTIAAAMPKILSFHDKTKFEHAGASGGFIDYFGYPFCRGRILDTVETDENQYDTELDIFWATGACMIIRAEIFKTFGGFDGDFFAHMEEIDLCWRIKNAGFSIKVFPQSHVYHVGGGTLSSESPFKLYLNFRNNLYMLYKNLPTKRLFSTLFVRMLLDGISALIFLAGGKFQQFLVVPKAHFAFYTALSALQKKRKLAKKLVKTHRHASILKGSIVFKALIMNKKTFDKLSLLK